MYLSRLDIENFRIIGSSEEGNNLELELKPGLNIIVGENNSGKSALVDAIRHVLGMKSNEWYPINIDDFHYAKGQRAKTLKIVCEFKGIDDEEGAALLEYINISDGDDQSELILRLTLEANRREKKRRFDREINVHVKAGLDVDGKRIEAEARNIFRVTYLRPLRDAEKELAAKRGSRLSQILQAHSEIRKEEKSDWKEGESEKEPKTITGIMHKANYQLRELSVIENIESDLNKKYLKKFILEGDSLYGNIDVAGYELNQILERLKLTIRPDNKNEPETPQGLGINNLLFIATEFLLLGDKNTPDLPLVLIEEPEAHLHPQLQLNLIDFLEISSTSDTSNYEKSIQVLLTSNSPNIASRVNLENIVMMKNGIAFSLHPRHTELDDSDYEFLSKFLDVTKSNLFFARGVIIVEGYAEQLLIPNIAELINLPLHRYGVTIVNVGHRGLYRYSKIFQRKNGKDMGIKVACVVDRDIPPDEASSYISEKTKTFSKYNEVDLGNVKEKLSRFDGGPVKTFISPKWTLEHDLAYSGLSTEVNAAIKLAKKTRSKGDHLSVEEYEKIYEEATEEIKKMNKEKKTDEEIAASVYSSLFKGQASKPETAQYLSKILFEKYGVYTEDNNKLIRNLPDYIVDAIKYAAGINENES